MLLEVETESEHGTARHFFFFFSSRRRHTRFDCDWSSDVCSSDLARQDFGDEQLQQLPPTLAHPGDYRRTWTLPLVFSPIDPHVLYFGSQVLFRTAEIGRASCRERV